MLFHRPILAVAGPALAHVTRVLAVADELRAAGHTVHVATDAAWLEPMIRERGYSLTMLPLCVDSGALTGGSLALPDGVVGERVAGDLALIKQLDPALVLLDWRPTMRLAALLARVPVAALVNAHVTRHYVGQLAAPEEHLLTRVVGQGIADRLMPSLSPLFYRQWARPYQAIAQAHGIVASDDLRDYLSGDLTLFPELPTLAPVQPGSGVHIGPLIDYPLPTTPLPPLRDPVLYVSLGSTKAAQYGPALAVALRDWPGSVLATRAERDADWPRHWISVDYADPLAIAAQGHRIAWVYHGGNGSSYQLLKLWTTYPQQCAGAIVLTEHVEHQWNAATLAKLGVMRAVGSLHHISTDLADTLRLMRATTAPLPPPALTQELADYADAPQRGARAIHSWITH